MIDVICWSTLVFLLFGKSLKLSGFCLSHKGHAGLFLVLALVCWQVPGWLPLLRGAFGSLSVTSMMLAVALAWRHGTGRWLLAAPERGALLLSAIVIAVAFYPTALGIGALDPYAWGYGGGALPLAVGALALAAWLAGWTWSALTLALALAGWKSGFLASPNLWDALVDPLWIVSAVCGAGYRIYRLARRRWRKPRVDEAHALTSFLPSPRKRARSR